MCTSSLLAFEPACKHNDAKLPRGLDQNAMNVRSRQCARAASPSFDDHLRRDALSGLRTTAVAGAFQPQCLECKPVWHLGRASGRAGERAGDVLTM